MPEWTTIAAEVLAALTAGGWLLSRRRRRQESESHATEMAKAKAELTAALRESETKYTREALEIYTQQVVEPIRQQSERLYPDCVVIRELQNQGDNDNSSPS